MIIFDTNPITPTKKIKFRLHDIPCKDPIQATRCTLPLLIGSTGYQRLLHCDQLLKALIPVSLTKINEIPFNPSHPPYSLVPIQSLNKSFQMQQKEVLELIESIVKPLRARIAHLQKENQRIKAQLAGQNPPKHDYLRQRSTSKDERPHSKKKEQGEPQNPFPSPSGKKKEDASEKPVWGYARGSGGKPQTQMKSPPPKDKAPPMPVSPRGVPRTASKEKLQSQKRQGEKPADKKIAGGKKVDPAPEKAPSSSNELPPPLPLGELIGGTQQ